jgi:hypothetical protein
VLLEEEMFPHDHKVFNKAILSAIILLTCFAIFASSLDTSLKGTWILAYQSYGKGKANLANIEEPVFIEFFFEGNKLAARIWAGEDSSQALSWPAFVNDQGPLPIEAIELELNEINGTAYAHYRVKPSPTDDLILDIHEHYKIAEQGNTLTGKMEVTFLRNDANRGSYTLHRRFERKNR